MIRAGELRDEEIVDLLRRSIDRDLRRELNRELAWREHHGRRGNNPPRAYVPAWLLAQSVQRP
jgi:hypothetical protein